MKIRKLIPLLLCSSLAFLTGLVFLTVSRVSDAEDGRNAKQRRALESAERSHTPAMTGAGGRVRARVPHGSAGTVALVPELSPGEVAHVLAARRDFLSVPDHWQPDPDMTRDLQQRRDAYLRCRAVWADAVLMARIASTTGNVTIEMLTAGAALAKICQDLTRLTPEAARQWAEWEEGGWRGYALPEVEPGLIGPPVEGGNTRTKQLAEVRASVAAPLRPFLEELGYLHMVRYNLNRILATEADSAPGKGDVALLPAPREGPEPAAPRARTPGEVAAVAELHTVAIRMEQLKTVFDDAGDAILRLKNPEIYSVSSISR